MYNKLWWIIYSEQLLKHYPRPGMDLNFYFFIYNNIIRYDTVMRPVITALHRKYTVSNEL
jgi:hypothetical protein